jgi:hypothetical protein
LEYNGRKSGVIGLVSAKLPLAFTVITVHNKGENLMQYTKSIKNIYMQYIDEKE